MITMMSCRTQKMIEIQKTADTVFVHKTDTIKKTETKYQTIYKYNKDSIETNKYTVGDTVYIEKTRWKTDIQYVFLERQNSIKKVSNDSTFRSKNNINNKEVIKEKSKSVFEKIKEELGGWILYALVFLGCILLLKNTKIKDKI